MDHDFYTLALGAMYKALCVCVLPTCGLGTFHKTRQRRHANYAHAEEVQLVGKIEFILATHHK